MPPSVTIRGQSRIFQADKQRVVQFLRVNLERKDAVKYFNSYQDGSIKHWQDLLHALTIDRTDVALLTFDEAAFIGREAPENGQVIERIPIDDFRPEKRRPGRPPKKVAA